ncbi:MAG: NUDIX domain-containing protein [Candidatus Staskawiczbacteria bacterium]|nr:NUDIX domain-containing protein [Candidatus Staskawiczbacteria bacterium]
MKPIEKRIKNKVLVIVFKKLVTGEFSFLMLKRGPERGGFWQPVTGGVEEGESFEKAALREVQEELGITKITELIDLNYSYEFTKNGLDQFEKIFGVQISTNQIVKLSFEHTEYYWATKDEALDVYLKYPGNKQGLKELYMKITNGLER